MPQKDPIFTKRTKQFTITFPMSPMSYRRKIFILSLSLFIVAICGGISVYRILTSPNSTIFQIITSIVVSLILLSSPTIVLLRTRKLDRNE
jgi:hypothetical protein